MNLLKDPWIPIQRQSGKQELIIPSAITEQDDPVAFLAAPRPDFNGSLMQFLIGLLQTAFAPEFRELKRSQWRKWYETPPTKSELEEWFAPLISAFEFDGDGARFMQDLKLKDGEKKSISALLLENPGDNTLKNNSDHFIKRDLIKGLCKSCAATALFNLQINAPSGGAGHRTSLRGGGPLTTLIIEKIYNGSEIILWRNLWLNILPTDETVIANDNNQLKDIFPWLVVTRTSEKQQSTTSADVHPMQIFWNMPRRMRLDFTLLNRGNCDLCGVTSDSLLISYVTKNYGINYNSETFRHPLSPYYKDKKDLYLPKHLQPDGLGYKHWLSIALRGKDQENAKVVSYCNNERSSEIEQFKIWAFGYDTDNMKVRCFYEAYLPLYNIDRTIAERFAGAVASFIEAASIVLSFSRTAIKQAWFQSPENAPGNIDVSKEFWSNTESEFYSLLSKLKISLESGSDMDVLKLDWMRVLQKEAFALFSRWAESAGIGYDNMRRLGNAHSDLCKKLNGPKLKGVLNLPKGNQK